MSRLIRWFKPVNDNLSRVTVVVLILANLLPLWGILFWKWEVFPLLFLFWIENVMIGLINVLKMLVCEPRSPAKWAAKLFMIPFFCFHYGLFTLVHGIFVIFVFGGYVESGVSLEAPLALIAKYQLAWAIAAIFLSHLVSFVYNYIGMAEYKSSDLSALMAEPYARVVVLHVTIIFGGFLVTALGSPVLGLGLLLALKILIDVIAHVRQHTRQTMARRGVALSDT